MNKTLIVSQGNSFLITDTHGNISPGKFHGFFAHDTRYVSRFEIVANNVFPTLLDFNETNYDQLEFVLANNESPDLKKNKITIIHKLIIQDGIFGVIKLINNSDEEISFNLGIQIDSDFKDIFEVKAEELSEIKRKDYTRKINRVINTEEKTIEFSYQNKSFSRKTLIEFTKEFTLQGSKIYFPIKINPRGGEEFTYTLSIFNELQVRSTPNLNLISNLMKEEEDHGFKVTTDYEEFNKLIEQSNFDLHLLEINKTDIEGNSITIPAAGAPWFMTLFGRDSAITSYFTIFRHEGFSLGTLETLAKNQGKVVDDRNEEEPGKILHEIRFGEYAYFNDWVKFPYFGSNDSTPLFLILAYKFYKWTGNKAVIMMLKDSLIKALEWIDKYGDIDNDGYIEYSKKSETGIENQIWRDSPDSMQFENSEIAQSPIASADIQGYVYYAKHGLSIIAKEVWEDLDLSNKLVTEAAELKQRFNKDFWLEKEEYFAMGLDKDKRQIDTISSMGGHLIWSGIVNEDKIPLVVKKLMSDELMTKWGIRTISEKSAHYNPLSYHNGSIWPHDNAILSEGLYRNGYMKEAVLVAEKIINASKHFGYRLPETFAGFDQEEIKYPISSPVSASPQAWAAASSFILLKVFLGLEPDLENENLLITPNFPEQLNNIHVQNIFAFGRYFNISVTDKKEVIIVERR